MFTENQSRQLYVVKGTADTDVIAPVEVDDSHAATDLSSKVDGASQLVLGPNKDEFYLSYKGPKDGVQRSDIIKLCNVMDVRFTAAKDLMHAKKKVIVALASGLKDSSNKLTVTDDYVLNVEIHSYLSSGYDSTKVKFGAAHGTTGDAASDLYKKLAISLAKNFAREGAALVAISLQTASTAVSVTAKSTMTSLTSTTATGIILEEVEQPWRLGAAKQEFVNFEAKPSTVYSGGVDVVWGTVTDATPAKTNWVAGTNAIVNSKTVADMEYFFHKNRGDVYGLVGFPNNIDTTYMVDASNAYGYSFVDIHYFTEGNSHSVGKSEKTLTIVAAGAASNPQALLKKLIGNKADSSASPAVAASGLYKWLDGIATIKASTNW